MTIGLFCADFCGNYNIDPGEQCDDGNPFSGDGCSSTCQLEDENFWLCTNATEEGQGPTTCCKALINPINNNRTCSCAGVQSASSMYSIMPDCTKSDVNECAAGLHNCHANAVCNNFNGALPGAKHGYECICPPGLLGNGISECRLYAYVTQFTVANPTLAITAFDAYTFKMMLYNTGTIPFIGINRITISNVQEYVPANGQRRRALLTSNIVQRKVQHLRRMNHQDRKQLLLPQNDKTRYSAAGRRILQTSPSSGTSVTVSIASVTAEEQNTMIAAINLTKLESNGYDVVVSPPTNTMSSTEFMDEPTYTSSSGFQVSAVQYNESTSRWMVTVRYTPDSPNVITSLYVSKPGTTSPTYTVEAINSYFISRHPCLLTQSACCMNDYKRIYAVGSFANNITSSIGTCGQDVQAADTLALGFDPSNNQYIVDHLFDNYPDSSVERISDGEVRLHIAQTDLSEQGLAKREDLPGGQQGYMLTFFVGMTYFTLLPANSLSVAASQVQIQLAVSNSLTFSFASSQDYTVLKYITMSLIQTKWIDDFVERQMQFVKVGFVLPTGLQQNMNTGLVPLNSIRFAIAKSMPSQLNASAWTNPCFSGDSSGLYDPTNVYGYHDMYLQAQQQTCAARQNLCTNPTEQVMPTNLVNFFFPIGDNAVTPQMLASYPSPYYIYVFFQLSALDSYGKVVVTSLFAKAQLNILSLSKACELVTAEVSLLGTTKVDVGIGLVGLDSDWNTTMRIFRDITQSVRRSNLLKNAFFLINPCT